MSLKHPPPTPRPTPLLSGAVVITKTGTFTLTPELLVCSVFVFFLLLSDSCGEAPAGQVGTLFTVNSAAHPHTGSASELLVLQVPSVSPP